MSNDKKTYNLSQEGFEKNRLKSQYIAVVNQPGFTKS
jgi:hypothetical protein